MESARVSLGCFVLFKTVVLLVCMFDSVEAGCDGGWISHEQMCYHFSHDTEDLLGAKDMCEFMGGNLVEIEDEQENMFLAKKADLYQDTYWIGLTDVQEEGTYIWMTSRTMPEYTNWEDGEPNNFHMNENCVEIRMDGTWNDDVCHSYNRYICEKINEDGIVIG